MRTDTVAVDDIIDDEVSVTVVKKKSKEEPKGKGGRPKLAPEAKKSKRVMAYFTEDEHEALMELIEDSGVSLSNFVRMSALAKLKE